MGIKRVLLFICSSILAVVLFSVITRVLEGERGKIKRVIFFAKSAVEKEDLLRLGKCVSFDYRDSYGHDRESLLFTARTVFNEYEDMFFQIETLKIGIDESTAAAEMDILGMGRSSQEAEKDGPLEYDKVKLKVDFRKVKKHWKVIKLEFLEPQGADLLRELVPSS